MPFFLDNQSAQNPIYYKLQTIYIEIKYHWVRKHVNLDGEFRTVSLVSLRTGEQIYSRRHLLTLD